MSQEHGESLSVEQQAEAERKLREYLRRKGVAFPENGKILVSYENGEIQNVTFIEGDAHKLQ